MGRTAYLEFMRRVKKRLLDPETKELLQSIYSLAVIFGVVVGTGIFGYYGYQKTAETYEQQYGTPKLQTFVYLTESGSRVIYPNPTHVSGFLSVANFTVFTCNIRGRPIFLLSIKAEFNGSFYMDPPFRGGTFLRQSECQDFPSSLVSYANTQDSVGDYTMNLTILYFDGAKRQSFVLARQGLYRIYEEAPGVYSSEWWTS